MNTPLALGGVVHAGGQAKWHDGLGKHGMADAALLHGDHRGGASKAPPNDSVTIYQQKQSQPQAQAMVERTVALGAALSVPPKRFDPSYGVRGFWAVQEKLNKPPYLSSKKYF